MATGLADRPGRRVIAGNQACMLFAGTAQCIATGARPGGSPAINAWRPGYTCEKALRLDHYQSDQPADLAAAATGGR